MRALFLENLFFRVCVILAAAGVLSLATIQPNKGLLEELSEGKIPSPGVKEAVDAAKIANEVDELLRHFLGK